MKRFGRGEAGSESGAGLISTIAGLLVFLALMLFATQTLIALYARSAATSAAYEGARAVAGARTSHDSSPVPENARAHAESAVRSQLGSFGERIELDWSTSTWDTVALTIRARPPGFLWDSLRGAGPPSIERTVRVRVEQMQ
ncbi:MAG: TadE family protein [Acidimicrobiales bacterium]